LPVGRGGCAVAPNRSHACQSEIGLNARFVQNSTLRRKSCGISAFHKLAQTTKGKQFDFKTLFQTRSERQSPSERKVPRLPLRCRQICGCLYLWLPISLKRCDFGLQIGNDLTKNRVNKGDTHETDRSRDCGNVSVSGYCIYHRHYSC
jgi:hypothetical protein